MAAELQQAKRVVLDLHAAFDTAPDSALVTTLAAHTSGDYSWRGVHPFNEQRSAQAAVDVFWLPLRDSFSSLQRRDDVFMAGYNVVDDGASVWVVSMGHFAGLFDTQWLSIPATRKLTYLRYAEFHRIDNGVIAESAMFCDILSIMHQAGCYPLQPSTGAATLHPGPMTHDGLLYDAQPAAEGRKSSDLVGEMVQDLTELNESGNDHCPPALLQKTWHDDMTWYGPTGIGATYTIPRYQEQHQSPFRTQLKDKKFNGHVARFGEGHYVGFFGWPNLTNTPTGGFLGLPGNEIRADMRIVDIYRRAGDKLAENWVFIDLLHWLEMQGVDLLQQVCEERPGQRP